ncbi:MAG: hypothetical protein AAFZ15_32165 [Bacteroidota bacterium]
MRKLSVSKKEGKNDQNKGLVIIKSTLIRISIEPRPVGHPVKSDIRVKLLAVVLVGVPLARPVPQLPEVLALHPHAEQLIPDSLREVIVELLHYLAVGVHLSIWLPTYCPGMLLKYS